jgi:hypothetical protein
MQGVLLCVEAVAEDMAHFAVPFGAHFYSSQDGQILLRGKFLDTGHGVDAIVIGYRYQGVAFGD